MIESSNDTLRSIHISFMLELIFLIISLILVIACGIFVMAEFALITVNRTKIERLAESGDNKAKSILDAITGLSTQLSSAQVGITITNLAIGFLAEPAIAHFLKGPLLSIGLAESVVPQASIITGIAIATVFTMLFGELIPKNLAITRPLASAKLIVGPLLFFTRLMRYPIKLLNLSANAILRLVAIEPQEELASARSADELVSLVRRSALKGTLAKETATILERSLAFGDQTALDIMTPRVQVKALDAGSTVSDMLDLARETGLSRFPVYNDSLDDIIGVAHIKNAFVMTPARRKTTKVAKIVSEPVLVPSTIELEPLLEALRHGGLQMAIVIDEFGGMDGIVTIEDVLEELVGEVRDEHDTTRPDIVKKSASSWLVSGLLRPDEIAEQLQIALPDEEGVETLGGLVTSKLERIPNPKDFADIPAIDASGNPITVTLRVQKMDANRVDRILMTVDAAGDAKE